MKHVQKFDQFNENDQTPLKENDRDERTSVDQYFDALEQLLMYKKEIPDYIKKMNPREEKVFTKALNDFMKSINVPLY